MYAQNRNPLGKIAILPFTGGSMDEQEGIPELFSFTQEMMQNFAVIPRTGITQAAKKEQSFQATSGMTDADTIARLGNQVGADYVMAGSITSLGSKNLLIVSIVKIDIIRQVAGVYLVYDSLDELNRNERILNTMSDELVAMARNAPEGLDRLALLPVELQQGGNKQEGDALAQILAIHLLDIGTYAVYPRTGTLDQVTREYETQLKSGVTRADQAVKVGKADNPPYVLSVISRKIAATPRFNATIIDLEKGNQIVGESEKYASLSDGIAAMEVLAMKLSGIKVSKPLINDREHTVEDEIKAQEQAAKDAEKARARAAAMDNFLKKSGIAFGGWLGIGIGNGSSKEKVDKDTGEVTTSRDPTINGGGDVELRLYRYFGIQTGINRITDYAPYTPPNGKEQYEKLGLIQIPVLARVTFTFVEYVSIAAFGGVGINVSVSTSDADSADPSMMSVIAGIELGFKGNNFYTFFGGYRWNGSIGDGSFIVDGASYDYSMGIHMIELGLRFYLPLRKS
jgi:hypothetical protein